jgi:hypothetical protein
MESLIDDVADMAASACDPESQRGDAKRRRLVRKESCGAVSGNLATRSVPYYHLHDWRSRRHAQLQLAAQHMDQRLQRVLLRGTVDYDIRNCLFTLVHQAVQRLQIQDAETWREELQTLHDLAATCAGNCFSEFVVLQHFKRGCNPSRPG